MAMLNGSVEEAFGCFDFCWLKLVLSGDQNKQSNELQGLDVPLS